MRRLAILAVVILALAYVPFLVGACGEEEPAPAETGATAEPTAEPTEEEADAAAPDIVDVLAEAGDYATLATALTEAGLVDTLKGEGPFTIFAPTDEAFEKLPDGTIEALLEDPQGQLTDILSYHVVPGKVMSSDLSSGMAAMTAQGSVLVVTVAEDGGVMVDGATVTVADTEASNGVIHAIDTVLFPPPQGGT